MPLGEPGRAVDLVAFRSGPATRIRDDLDVPVIIVQTETDVLGHLDYLPARQPDNEWLRLWEVAGTAHADKFQIGDFEDFLGCPDPVNRGQQAYVVRAALRHLDTWAGGGQPAPIATRLDVEAGSFMTDPVGNTTGGVRTPVVDAPVEVLSGLVGPDASTICRLFGSTRALDVDALSSLYPGGVADYLLAYERATQAAIAGGFILEEDRAEVLADARPELIERRTS